MQARSGTAVIIQPESQLMLEQFRDSGFFGYWVTFDIYSQGWSKPLLHMQECFPYEQMLAPALFMKVVDLFEQLVDERPNTGTLELFKQQIRLQELLLLLLEAPNEASPSDTEAKRAVERSVAYMEEHYDENITVELLARQAGVRRSEYSALFQQLTGHKPLDYLTEQRLKRAKELLLLSNRPLRDIAHHIGFRDEYYFNRRFRQAMGISPKQYARTHPSKLNISDDRGLGIELPLQPQRSKIVVVGFPLGHLMALGVRPIGADMTVIGKQVVYQNELQHVHDIGPREDFEKIKALEPDFIFCCSTVNMAEVPMSRIAPTMVVDRAASNFEQLRLMAAVVGKSPCAEQWIRVYKAKLKAM
ncbi:helix-turn-helix domain-containing protein [Paenibacillus sp. NPDC058174]|uniref:helix-turn-helix domain-containing protein n=1 Tax=Paenibacillus sp. NPDC058174 TaxID=3346366 RepID=UPI0036DC7EAB